MEKSLLATALLITDVQRFPPGGYELIGTRTPQWNVSHWINFDPLQVEELRGKVILVRWWTAPDCPFCAATVPALREFHRTYGGRGLVTIGFCHHKASTFLNPPQVKRYADQLGFEFPIAIDPEWQTLRRWWLNGQDHHWTSASFLIDGEGMIRYIHPGNRYTRDDPHYLALKNKIEELLEEQRSFDTEK